MIPEVVRLSTSAPSRNNLGHWEKNEFYCYKCGKKMEIRNDGSYVCSKCGQAMEKQKDGSLKFIHK